MSSPKKGYSGFLLTDYLQLGDWVQLLQAPAYRGTFASVKKSRSIPDHRRARVKISRLIMRMWMRLRRTEGSPEPPGIERNEIERGTIIQRPDTLMLSNRMDAT